jgi:hypothetical protein
VAYDGVLPVRVTRAFLDDPAAAVARSRRST